MGLNSKKFSRFYLESLSEENRKPLLLELSRIISQTILSTEDFEKNVKEIIEELNRQVNAIEGGKQTLNRLGNYLKILVNNKP